MISSTLSTKWTELMTISTGGQNGNFLSLKVILFLGNLNSRVTLQRNKPKGYLGMERNLGNSLPLCGERDSMYI